MKFDHKPVIFPAIMRMSFAKLIDSLAARTKSARTAEAAYLREILDRADKCPELKEGIDIGSIEEHREIVDDLMSTIFPAELTDNELKYAATPWDFTPFYSSNRLSKYSMDALEDFGMDKDGINADSMYISACTAILGMHYGKSIPGIRPFFIKLPEPRTGRTGHFRLAINADFMTVTPTDKAVEITEKDFNELVDNYNDIALWKQKFPENSWIFSGFMIMNLMDLTMDWNINKLSSDLLNVRADGIKVMKDNVSELLGIKDLQLSLVTLAGRRLIQGDGGGSMPNLMLGQADEMSCESVLCPYLFEEIIAHDRPVALPDVKRYADRSKSKMGENLVKAGLKSYYVHPIVYNDEKLGFLELGSSHKGLLNSTTSVQLEQVIPILAIAGNRFREEYRNRIEAVIQEECTTIHASVKWRFEEEASKHIKSQDSGGDHQFTDLIFKDVYPLYGQLDISGSSTIRNESVKNDLISQLEAVKGILNQAQQKSPLPAYEELVFVIESYVNLLNTNMDAASEHDIQRFLHREIDPILPHLAASDEDLETLIESYKKSLNDELHILYKERKSFDDSVKNLNGVLANYLDKKQEEAQKMFPHYFERYKTDGVEFNMYIGNSIAPDKGFSPLMLNNLRLWQLMVMVEMEWEFHQLRKSLKKKLNIASLILAHRAPLTIHFRLDEKQFDVDGAYNARYEIIKKRVDKAHIKGTQERITQVGKIVIVYTNDEDETEYLRYIHFLQSKGYFENAAPEILTVEDLQGVSGLKALRIGIDFTSQQEVTHVSMEEIMQEIEGKGKKEKV